MTEIDYLIKQFSKTNKKNFENYVITRIWHLLNQTDIKIITQQYVKRKKGYALTDLYFPQFDLHIEIDEPHHIKQYNLDIDRETDIIEATKHKFQRIKYSNELKKVNKQIDEIVSLILNLRKKQILNSNYEKWDLKKEFNPNYYRKKGYLDVDENPAFRKIVDACNCLGQNYIGCQKAYVKSKKFPEYHLWFPKFYENQDWDNRLDTDAVTIIERPKNTDKAISHYIYSMNNPVKRIVFPRSKNNLGYTLYRFKGIYEPDIKKSSVNKGIFYRRISKNIAI